MTNLSLRIEMQQQRPRPYFAACFDCGKLFTGEAPGLAQAAADNCDHVSDVPVLVNRLILAAIELAALRHDLCRPDSEPLDVEGAREVAEDVCKALQGIDTCETQPAPEFVVLAALERAAGILLAIRGES